MAFQHATNALRAGWLPQAGQAGSRRCARRPVVRMNANQTAAEAISGYFEAWNRRDIEGAVQFIAEDAVYEDSLFPNLLMGRQDVQRHFEVCGKSIPAGVIFVVDSMVDSADGRSAAAKWHLETAGGMFLPNSRGVTMVETDESGLIKTGFDVPEPSMKIGPVMVKVFFPIIFPLLELKERFLPERKDAADS